MSTLIRKVISILLPVVTIIIIFELLARTIPTTYSIKHNNLIKKKSQIEILVLGSSHSNFGINPKYFDREAFNISNTSQCLYQDYNVLLRYLPECKNIKMVIIPISYFTLQSDLALSVEAWRCAYYSFYMGVQGEESPSLFELRNHSALVLWDGPIGVINNLVKVNKMGINEYGYQVPEKTRSKIDDIINDNAGKARVAYHDKLIDHNLLGANIVILNKMANELNKSNIKFVFVTTPVYKTYYQHVSRENYEIMTNTINLIASKYSTKHFNYFYDDRFDLNNFLDNDHLNEEGAKKFSIILKNEVIEKLL